MVVISHTWWISHTVGLPSKFLCTPNPHAHPKSFEIWPTSLVEGERPGGAAGNERECRGT